MVLRQQLTRAQRALWSAQQAMPLCPINIAEYVELTGDIDPDLLRTVTQEVGRQTGIAFTRFEQTSSGVEQVIDHDLSGDITVSDLRGEADPMNAAHEWMRADYTRPVDLFTDRLMASAILRVADDKWLYYQRGHHLTFDGTGAFKTLKLVASAYNQRVADGPVDDIPAADLAGLAQADIDYRASSRYEKDREYWREHVAELTSPASLSHRVGHAGADPRRVSCLIPAELVELLQRAESALKTSLPVLVGAAASGYLSRMTARDDVALSLPVAARTTATLRNTYSTVSNVVPLRTAVGAESTLASAVASTQAAMMGALRHQRFRFEDIRELMDGATSSLAAREFAGPLLNLMLTVDPLQFGDATGSLHILTTSAVDDLAVNLYRTGNPHNSNEFRFDLEANPNRYGLEELRGHHGRLLAFIESFAATAVSAPGTTVDDLPLLSRFERDRVPLAAAPPLSAMTLPQLLDEAAFRHSDRPALHAGWAHWTYDVLAARSRQLAHILQARGAKPGTTVAIGTGRGLDQVLSFWAVAHTGATIMQLDPAHPAPRIAAQLADSDPVLVLTASGGIAAEHGDRWFDLTNVDLAGASDAPLVFERPIQLADVAYLVYTSGSTGTPKGVQVTHRGLSALMQQQRHLGADDVLRVSGLASPAFDASIFEILFAAAGGGALCPAPSGIVGGAELADFLNGSSVTHTVITPSVLSSMDPAALRDGVSTTLMLAGEACPPDVVRRWGTGREVFNLYGPAESTVMATGTEPLTASGSARPPIGRPIVGMSCYVLDHRLRPLPPGAVGDLYLAGPALAQGYSKHAGLTAAAFIANPWGGSGSRMYRTGDRVRWSENFAELHYVGRSDDQVQIRGVRVEPGEIAMAAMTHPAVHQAAAIVVGDEADARLALYIASPDNDRRLTKRVRNHISLRLPTSMWPAHIVQLDALPITTTGKLDRAALPHPSDVDTRTHRAAVTESERLLAEAISDVLTITNPSMDDDILALGGSSLDATRIVARIKAVTGSTLGVRDVLEAADLAELAEVIDRTASGPQREDAVTIRPPRPEASSGQISLILADRLQPGSTANHLSAAIELRGTLDRDALIVAITDVVERHEALRTIIRMETDGTDWQEIVSAAEALFSADFGFEAPETDFDLLSADTIDPTVRPPLALQLRTIDEGVHQLLVRTHHAAVDGWSLGVLVADLAIAYRARIARADPAWAPTTQYIDAGVDARVASEVSAAQLERWQRRLENLPSRPELPTDLSVARTRTEPAPAAVVRRALGPEMSSALNEAATQRGTSTFAWLHACLAVTIARYTGADDLVIVVPQAGRSGPDLDNAVGMYVNPVATRIRIAAAETFDGVLVKSTDAIDFALDNADVPFSTVAAAVEPRRDITVSPLADILLTYQNQPLGQWNVDDLQIEVHPSDSRHARAALQWSVDDTADGLRIELTYRSDLFSQSMAAALCHAYVTAIAQSVAVPSSSPAELVPGSQTPVRNAVRPAGGTLVDRIRDVAQHTPNAPALTFGDETRDYGRLVADAETLATELQDVGVGRGDLVAVALPRNADALAVQLAVLWAGAAYVPIDPDYPQQRIAAILEDANPRAVVVSSSTKHHFSASLPQIDLDGGRRPIESSAPFTPVDITPSDGAYVIFTSGSTGRPKGVSVTHGNAIALLDAARQSYTFTPHDVFSCTHSTAFDVSVFEIFAAWTAGARVVLVDRPTVLDPQLLWPLLRQSGVTILSQTPSAFYPLAVVATRDADPGQLRAVVFAGEALRPARLLDWRAAFGERVLLSNMYGITETTVHLTIGPVTPSDSRSLIGEPLAGTTLLILDRHLHPVPVGVWGELYACGPQVTRGYVGKPALTAERFVACPEGLGGGRMYRSGDVVRMTIDGDLEYRGRSDRQVQVRGHRVEPGDIASALTTISGVAEAEVLIRNTESAGGGDITGYVRLRTDDLIDDVLDEDRLRVAAGQVLPGYLVPARIVVVQQWPLNASGKRDLAALPIPAAHAEPVGEGVISPVRAVVAEVLRIDPGAIGPNVGLFDLGANSLSAMHIALLLSERTGRDVGVRMVADSTSIADLETAVNAAPRHTNPGLPTGQTSPPPPTSQQRALWVLSRIDAGSAVYHLPAVLDLPGAATPRTVVDALTDVVARHEVLRTVLADNAGLPQPQLLPIDRVRNQLSGLLSPRPLPTAHAAANLQAEALRPFDLATDLPWRADLFSAEPGTEQNDAPGAAPTLRLLLVAHHVAVDGWSMTVLAEDFGRALRARIANTAPTWPAPAAQYRDHAWAATRALGTPGHSSAYRDQLLDHWSRVLDGAPIHLQLPFQANPAQMPSGPEPAQYLDVAVSERTRAALQQLAVGESASVFHVLHAALAATLGQFTGTDDIVIGTPTAGRTTDMMSAVGMFVQTVVLRSDTAPAASLRTAIRLSHHVVTDAIAHAEVSFEEVKEQLAPPRTLDSDAYLDVMIAYQLAPSSPAERDVTLTPIRVGQARVPLEFTITDNGEGAPLQITLTYGLWHVRPAMAQRLIGALVRTIEAMSRTVDPATVTMHELTAPDAEHLADAQMPAVPALRDDFVDVTEAIVLRAYTDPDAVAVSDADGAVTYSELVSRAIDVAGVLRDRSVGRGDFVAVLADRNTDTVVAMVGVLLVGAGYVPIEPTYPAERIAGILRDANPAAVLGASRYATAATGLADIVDIGSTAPSPTALADLRDTAVAPRPNDPAYVIYTSGSTGTPKGVVITRSNMATLLESALSTIDARTDDVWTWFHSAAFDFSVWEIFGPLTSGGRVVVVDHDTAREPAALVELLNRQAVTILNQTPTAFSRLLQLPTVATGNGRAIPESLRVVLFGGEALDPKALASWHARHRQVRLVNMYGITETTVHASVTEVDVTDSRSLIGSALPGVGLVVLDRYLRPQPVGATGELYITGPQVTAGYANMPGLTATRFVATPWGPAGSRMYRTGDLARWVDDSRLEYLGRGDQQLKIRGHRIEPGEITAVLRAQSGVADAKVLLRNSDRVGEEVLVAYVVVDDAGVSSTRLRTACAAILPAHLVPAQVQIIDDWPLTSTGKLDVARLPALTAPEASRPLHGTEVAVAAAVAEVLDIEAGAIGPDTNFFELGGNSLSAARLSAAISAVTGADLPVRAIFEQPTIALLAADIDTASVRPQALPVATPVRRERPSRVPLTAQQQALWLNWQLDPERTDYNLGGLVPMADMSPERIGVLVRTLVARHEGLRTRFPADSAGPWQQLVDTIEVDTSAQVVADPMAALAELDRPFDLERELPWRIAVFESPMGGVELAVVVHHIVVDGESVRVLHAEAAALAAGIELPPVSLDYGDYTAWAGETLAHNGQILRQYWEGVFAEPVSRPQLPCLRPPVGEAGPASIAEVVIDPVRMRQLREQAQAHHSSPFMVVHAVLAVLLARLGDEPDVVIGTVAAGRDTPEFARTVGMLARTVLLRTDIDIERPFSAIVRQVTRTDLDSLAHGAYPAEAIADLADPEHRRGVRPVVDVFVADLGTALEGNHTNVERPYARFGLDLTVAEVGDALQIRLAYSESRMDTADAKLFVDRLATLLYAVLDDPAAPPARHLVGSTGDIESIPQITDFEPLPDLLRRSVMTQPLATAVEDEAWVLSYRDLDSISTTIARALIARGIGAGDVVAICVQRSAWSILATWAIAKTGAAFVTLGVNDPLSRQRTMARAAGATIGLHGPGQRPELSVVDWLDLADVGRDAAFAGDASAFRADERRRSIRPDDVAYIIFTSGSTGEPKGVSVTHAGLRPLVDAVITHVDLTPDNRVLHNYATTFDAHLIELIPAFAAGATVVVCPPEVIGGNELGELLTRRAITTFFSTPAVMATIDPETLSSVRIVVTGGEALQESVAARWAPGRRIVNFYGPTEATIAATANPSVVAAPVIPIGRSMAAAAAYVLDHRLRPVPHGIVGELYLAGPAVARGYTGASALTSTRFVAHPFDPNGSRMYRTGDLVHRNASGDIVMHGRSDEQIKVRGVRLEPAEIDAALMSLPGVERATTAISTGGVEPVLASWLIPDPDHPFDAGSIRDQLRAILPGTHIPTHITVVDHFPMTPSGKLDRRALPAPSPVIDDLVPLQTPTEDILAAIWAEVLDVPAESLGRQSEFFATGGTSLSASRVAGRLRQQLNRDVTVRHVLDARSLAALAASVDLLAPSLSSRDAPHHRPVPADLGLAYPQQRLWVLNRIDQNSTAYVIPMVLRLTGALDTERLADAVAELQRRHGTLRATYPQTSLGPRQLVGEPAEVRRAPVTDIPGDGVMGRIAELITTPFDLTTEPGFRAEVLVAGESEAWLVIALHHVAADGWSMPILLGDLVGAYSGELTPGPALTYADFTQWQGAHLGDPADPASRYAQQIAFWRREMADVPGPVRLPGRATDPSDVGDGGAVHGTIDATTLASLTAVGQAESSTLFHVTHTALAALLAQRTGSRDLVVGAPVLGRDDPVWEPVVGMFVNTLALRTVVDPESTVRTALRRTRDTDLTAHAHADVPYDAVARAVSPAGRAGTAAVAGADPLISVLLVHQEALGAMTSDQLALPGLEVEVLSDTARLVAPKYDLEFVLSAGAGGDLDITVVHGPAIPAGLADELLAEFTRLLLAAATAPDQPFPVVHIREIAPRPEPAEISVAAPPSWSPAAEDLELEGIVTAAMATVLGLSVGEIDRDASFFDIGGTSLSATQVVAIIGEATATAIPVRHVFAAPSPIALTSLLLQSESPGVEALPPLTGAGAPPDLGPVPLSPAQQRLWLIQQMLPERPLYAVPVVVGVPSGADPFAAWNAVAARHAPLRTIYPDRSGAPVQVTLDEIPPITDLGDRELTDVVATLLATPFDLTASVPVRPALVDQSGHRFLVIVAHHIAMDGESVAVLRRDLDAALAGRPLQPLPVDYGQVSRWQNVVNAGTRDEMLSYWQQALAGYPGVLELPDCAPRDPQRSLRTATVAVPVDEPTTEAVALTARRRGVSEFHVYHAAVALTLSIACGTDDVAVGTPVSLRRHPETADMVGMFVSTVALRTTLHTGMTTDDLLELVRDIDLAALDHALLPFDEVVAQQDPIRELGRHPVVQVTLSVNDEPGGHVPNELSPNSEFDLQVTVGRDTAMFTYATALYDKRAIETLALRWKVALRLIVADEITSLEAADLRTEEERADRLHRVPSRPEVTLGELLQDSLRRRPAAVAVDDGVTAATYAQLDHWSAAVAADLQAAGVEWGDPVAMMLPRSVESVVAFWAIARLGAVYVPVDPRYPSERIERMIAISGAQVAVTAPNAAHHCRVQVPVAAPDDNAPVVGWTPMRVDDAAYLLFTSGTTGNPNGVVVSHRGLRNLVEPAVFSATDDDRVAHLASPSFDASILEMVWAFASGVTLAVVPADDASGRTLTDQLQQLGVTQAFATPSVLATLDETALPALRALFVGGEACPPELVRRWSHGRSLTNLYGPTETTVLGTARGSMQPESAAVIGRGVPGLRSHVLDSHLRPTPDGAVGELYFTGSALALGYRRDPALTAARFVAAPGGERMYRTGDLVRRLESGDLEYLGRADRQVKIRGQRIEPGEVDAALVAAGARTAATVLRTGPTGPVLVSYVIAADPTDSVPERFMDVLVAQLPHHLVPAAVVLVPELPRTPVGKLDTAALPEPVWTVAGGVPRTPTEAAVVEVFRDVVGNHELGIYDDFFAVGGNSLLLASAAAALTARLGRPVPAAVLFAQTTPVALAAVLDQYADLAAGLGAVVDLSAGRAGTPLWCIHPISGLVNDYRPLAATLSIPVLGLQMPGLDDPAAPHLLTIEELAAHHVATIRSTQPSGPYRLLGWSLGAVLAHEVTRQLTASGAVVDTLVLLDPRLDHEASRGAAIDASLEAALRAIDHERFEQYRVRCVEAITAAAAYQPGPSRAERTILIAAQDNPDPTQWEQLVTGTMNLERVPVAHHAMGSEEAMTAIAGLVGGHIDAPVSDGLSSNTDLDITDGTRREN
ncbi:non-ribosomal peptide synthetase [Williamsia soli]|uniref:non-ribosomal peptide synthetase n=1 Tax=Williamsia soli TaxID=364929 RepID=UPI001F303BB6|nr:non-ribosomal peptide synthetase [Williamsia soli]